MNIFSVSNFKNEQIVLNELFLDRKKKQPLGIK